MFPDFWRDGDGPDPENDGYLPDVEVIIISDRLATFPEMPIAHQRDMKNTQLRTIEEE